MIKILLPSLLIVHSVFSFSQTLSMPELARGGLQVGSPPPVPLARSANFELHVSRVVYTTKSIFIPVVPGKPDADVPAQFYECVGQHLEGLKKLKGLKERPLRIKALFNDTHVNVEKLPIVPFFEIIGNELTTVNFFARHDQSKCHLVDISEITSAYQNLNKPEAKKAHDKAVRTANDLVNEFKN